MSREKQPLTCSEYFIKPCNSRMHLVRANKYKLALNRTLFIFGLLLNLRRILKLIFLNYNVTLYIVAAAKIYLNICSFNVVLF